MKDPSVVKWVARYREQDGNVIHSNKLFELHPCTDEDLAKFHPPEKRSVNSLERLKKGGGLFCLDWDELDLDIFGVSGDGRHASLAVLALPCHVRETAIGANHDKD